MRPRAVREDSFIVDDSEIMRKERRKKKIMKKNKMNRRILRKRPENQP